MSHKLFLESKAFRRAYIARLASHRFIQIQEAQLEEAAPTVWYHGDPSKRTSFASQKMDRDRQNERGGNENGPGIYWTSEYDEAESYGKVIHHAMMKVLKARLLTDTTKATPQNVAKLISLCDKAKRDDALQNWAETTEEALPLAIRAYVGMRTFADAAVAIYHDIFGYEADPWAKAMVETGFDAYQPSKRPHFIVYNPAVIQLVKEDMQEAWDDIPGDYLPYVPKDAAGGVLVNLKGQVLLREPTSHFGGYVWTWPKGTVDPKEEMIDAALREVKEETGVTGKVWKRLGKYLGTSSYTTMYLMHVVKQEKEHDKETIRVKWATPEEAADMIAETTHASGRKRDLTILRDAIHKHPSLTDNAKALKMIGNLLSHRTIG